MFAALALLAATAGSASGASTPYLQYAPGMPRVGQTLTIYGRGFCSGAACSRVALTIDGRWVTKGIRPVRGAFVRSFKVTQAVGPHILRASQRGPNGRALQFSLRIVIGPAGRD